jgi:hypothetical protein
MISAPVFLPPPCRSGRSQQHSYHPHHAHSACGAGYTIGMDHLPIIPPACPKAIRIALTRTTRLVYALKTMSLSLQWSIYTLGLLLKRRKHAVQCKWIAHHIHQATNLLCYLAALATITWNSRRIKTPNILLCSAPVPTRATV